MFVVMLTKSNGIPFLQQATEKNHFVSITTTFAPSYFVRGFINFEDFSRVF